MHLTSIHLETELPGPERTAAILAMDEVQKSKFGMITTPSGAPPGTRMLIQPDGFRIGLFQSHLSMDYTLPTDAQDLVDDGKDAFDHIYERIKRPLRSIAQVGDGKVKWLGIVFTIQKVIPDAKNVDEALIYWGKELNSPMLPERPLRQLSFNVGFAADDVFFEGLSLNPFETRSLEATREMVGKVVDVQSGRLIEAGIQMHIDINTKIRNSSERMDKDVTNVLERARQRWNIIASWGDQFLRGHRIDG